MKVLIFLPLILLMATPGISLDCQYGGQGKAMQNITCPAAKVYCTIVHPKEGTNKDQKLYTCSDKSSLTTLGYSKTPGETLTCQDVTVNNVDGEVCACTKDYCNYGSILKASGWITIASMAMIMTIKMAKNN